MKNVQYFAGFIAKQINADMNEDFLKIVEQEVEKLPEPGKAVIEKRYGFEGECNTLATLAEEMGKTVFEIADIEAKCFQKVRRNVKKIISL